MKRATIEPGFGLGMAMVMMVAVVGAWTAVAQAQAPTPDQAAKLLGTFEIISGQNGDTEIPEDRLAGKYARVTRDMMFVLDANGKELSAVAYTLDNAEEPFRLSMTIKRSASNPVGKPARGLMKTQGDTVTLIYDHGENPDYPDDFEAEAQENLFVLKKTTDSP